MSKPTVTLKLATSLDARIALSDGTSQWITGSEARARVHQMRAKHDAVLVGIGTVLADDPLLTARTVPLPKDQPLRVVADTAARTPVTSRLVRSLTKQAPVALITGQSPGDDMEASARGMALADTGVIVSHKPDGAGEGGRASAASLLAGITDTLEHTLGRTPWDGDWNIFLEGGGELAASFIKVGLVDRIEWFRAPLLIGGDGLPAFGALGLSALTEAPQFRLAATERIGDDTLDTYLRS